MTISSPAKKHDPDNATACPSREPLFVAQSPLTKDGRKKIRRLIIANRGEIACRIIATCRKLNVTSVALYVQEDAFSRHVSDADEAISIGSAKQEGVNPFLNIKLLVDTALAANADAIHPGYGYLSENADFANATRAAGLVFVGPSSTAMSTLGDKRTAKAYLREHAPDVPLIPGFAGSSQEVEDLELAASKIGFPIMLKASAGGGGRGMRIVHERSALRGELSTATSEAARTFGSGDCILEKYIEAGKHIEIQIIGDSHGNVVSLWERECSVQRRHQKVIEETPSPWLSDRRRKAMSDVAVKIGKLLNYEGAGTVEFVVDVKDGSFYFLEVNTRLQVEHPITEEVTGLDIVSLQLFVAAGGNLSSLSVLQNIPQEGHAIEVRLCAEDPQRDFFPEHGTIRLWQPASNLSTNSRDIRYETAVQTGSTISIYFDSMIAKIVVWAPTRSLAIAQMVTVLANTVCAGLKTNQLFLQSCLLHEGFRDPAYTTSFIPSYLPSLLRNPHVASASEPTPTLALIPSVFLRKIRDYSPSPSSPRPFQHVRRGFRNQRFDPVNFHTDIITISDPPKAPQAVACIWKTSRASDTQLHEVHLKPLPAPPKPDAAGVEQRTAANELTARYNALSNSLRTGAMTDTPAYQVKIDRCDVATAKTPAGDAWLTATMDVSINGAKTYVHLATADDPRTTSGTTQTGQAHRVFCHFPALGTWLEYGCYDALSFAESARALVSGSGIAGDQLKSVVAPMPCKVLSVLKTDGQEVKAGETVMVVESMKMEMNISVAVGGKFGTKLKKGDAVDDGVLLCWVD